MTRLSQLLFQFTVDVEFEREKIIFIAHMFFFLISWFIFFATFLSIFQGLNLVLACPT